MADKKEVDKKDDDRDPELEDLLDSALQDMTKKEPSADQVSTGESQNMWSEEFIKEAAAQFESNMATILGSFSGVPEDQISQDQIAQTFSKMAEAAAQVLKPQGESNNAPIQGDPAVQGKIDDVSAAISQTLQNLNSNTENLQTPFSDADLANMFAEFNLSEGSQEGNAFIPFMQGMMQSLLSKEVLYPSLKELVDKYPDWLRNNKDTLDPAEYERFSQQEKLMRQVCDELEPEQESDPEDVKKRRFQVVLELMQKTQDLGQPPTELVGDMAEPPPGFTPAPDTNSQCSLM
ncbi:peroxisomal biogenesis factor 19 [Pieris rapae]|uniref:peroxisomal biogenesis factor 19 n=1 Tax=Pieris rapae TaxID=64459 RepID=UPI001E27A5B6|nr:peroxisomal biogenesis factor 19 [Pieris rapae]